MKQYGSQSMIAPLHKVLVKRPDEAFAIDDPVLWHYTGRPNLLVAQQEHDELVALLRQAGSEVVYHDESQPGHADAIEHWRQLRAFVPLARRQTDGQRPSAPVGSEVQLGREPAAAATERLVGRHDFPLFPGRPAARLARACAAPRPRADEPGRSCRQSRPPSRRPRPPRPLRPGGPGGPAPKRLGGASGAVGRGRSSTSHTVWACPARGRRCAAPRGCR